ncbi:MAG: hypothetical protein IJC87_02325 [Clostridia bacterium]|nr:hypothetical protein [Clostridia bacterium]
METKVILEKQDLRNLKWSTSRNSAGTAGSFLKSYSKLGGRKLYYKLSNYDSIKGVIGIESVNEIIVDRLLTLLGVEHLHYQLIKADIVVDEKQLETFVCVSEDFKAKGEDKIPLDNFYDVEHKSGEDRLTFCLNKGWEEYIYIMLVVDFLILNRDRHGANIEVLRNRKKRTIRIAPLFDHGISLLFNCNTEEEIEKYDILADKKINTYIGSNSAKENLNLIPKDKLPKFRGITENDKEYLFEDLQSVISPRMISKIWDMIYSRWRYYEDICNSRE